MVREGYKETEIGEIPVEWEVGPISDIAFVNPKTNTTLLTDRSEVTFLPMENVSESGKVMVNEVREFHEVKNGYTSFKEGDVLFAKITPCMQNGKGAHLTGLKNGVGFGSTEFHVLRPKSSGNSCFIYHLTLSKKFRLVSESYFSGSAGQQRVAKNVFYQYHVPLPPLPEQRRIAAVLSTIDEAIEKTEALIAKLRQVKAGLMQDLLTKGIDEEGRVRSEETHTFKDSEIGRVPVEWEVPELGEIYSEFKTGSTPRRNRPDYFKGDILWITSGELKFKPIVTTKEKITAEAVKNTNLRIYPPGTFFIAITGLEADGTRGSCAINLKEATTNQSCMAFYENSKLNTDYFYQYYRYFGEDLIFKYAHGTKQQSLNASIVRSIRIKMPPKEEQHRIAAILTAADDRIAREEAYCDKLLAMKKGLMADLLTGKVRVPEEVGESEYPEKCITSG